jgi:5-methyltetrahydropteroyltriglutamate--homocysteine methyltransferase
VSRAKLERLGIDLPVLPATTCGSLPKPETLVEARRRHARGELTGAALDDESRRAIEFWIRTQERLGLDVLVDGEMYRGDMVTYFAESMQGFAPGGLVRSYGNRYYRKPIITGAVRWPGPITVSWWQFAQSLTTRPVKGMVTGPYTMMDWSFSEHYLDRRNACLAIARQVRREVEALVAAGARIIQIDEPALSVRPDELGFAIEALEVVTQGLPAYFITHACYGAFEAIYPGMLALPVDNLDLAISHSSLDLLALFARDPFTKDMSVGVIDVHTHTIESQAEVVARIRRATRLLALESIWVSPDCGLKTRTVQEAEEKLAGMTEATRVVRWELTAGRGTPAPAEDA